MNSMSVSVASRTLSSMFCNSRRSFYESDAILIDQDAVLINQEVRRQLLIEAIFQILKDD